MEVNFNVKDLNNCQINISGMNTSQFDQLRVILYQLYQYKESSNKENPFSLNKLFVNMIKE